MAIASRHPRLRFDPRTVERAIQTLDENHRAIGVRNLEFLRGELSVVFLTDTALARLHAEFLDDPTTTDVITFEGDPILGTAGEICVSADTAAAYAREHERDLSSELILYLVHGWLHLAGYDDRAPAKKRAMRRAENRALRALAKVEALPKFSLRSQR